MGLKSFWKKFKKPILTIGGAALGTALLPGIGTKLGATISGALGGSIGSAAGAAVDAATDSGSWAGGGVAKEVPYPEPPAADTGPTGPPAFVFQPPPTGTPPPTAPPSSASQVVEVIGKGLSSGLGQLPAAAIGAGGQWLTNQQQQQQAERQMEFQAEQTGTGYQRAVKDMQAAGLNPMLAYSQGPAASGGGAQAQLGNMASSALQAMSQEQAIRNAKAEEYATYARADNTMADTELMDARNTLLKEQASQASMSTRESFNRIRRLAVEVENLMIENEKMQGTAAQYIAQQKIQTKIMQAQEMIAKSGAEEAKQMIEFWKSTIGDATPTARAIGTIFKGIRSIAGPALVR